MKIEIEFCKRTDARYQDIRDRHYVENRGTHGQQLHFIVFVDNEVAGIISAASSVYAVKARDEFFKIPKDRDLKQGYYLPAIINNTVFRLEVHHKNLATQVLSKWRKVCAKLWFEIYGVKVIGFETFVVEEDYRKGCLYKADNWHMVGETAGSTKSHKGLNTKSERIKTDKKLIFCKWVKKEIEPKIKYVSSWRAETKEERERAKRISKYKLDLIGKRF